MSKISEYLKKRLSRRGKRTSFAQRLGVTDATVSRWAQGLSLPDFESCLKISRYFQLDPREVFELAGKSEYEELYSEFFPEFRAGRLSEDDIYSDHGDANLHRRLQSLIERGQSEKIEVQIDLLEAQEELLESEERFRQLAEHSQEVFWMIDRKKPEFLYISPACEKQWGVSCETFYREPFSFLEIVHPDDYDRVVAMIEKQRQGEHTDEDFRIRHSDGSIRWVRNRGYPIRNESGEAYRTAGIMRDITDRVQQRQKLQESTARYQRLVESIEDEYFLYSYDADGHYTYVSPSITNILGYSQEEFLTHYSEYLSEDGADQVVYHATLSIQGKQQPPYEIKVCHKDGHTHKLRVIEVPIFDAGRNVTAVDGIAHDITEHKADRGEVQRTK